LLIKVYIIVAVIVKIEKGFLVEARISGGAGSLLRTSLYTKSRKKREINVILGEVSAIFYRWKTNRVAGTVFAEPSKLRNSNLKCGTSIGGSSIERKFVSSD